MDVEEGREAWSRGRESFSSDAIDALFASSVGVAPVATEGDEDGGGEGNREAPPVADTWAGPRPAVVVAEAEIEADAGAVVDTRAGDVAGEEDLLPESAAESGREARGVVDCRDRLTER